MTDRISPTFRRIHLLQRVRGSELTSHSLKKVYTPKRRRNFICHLFSLPICVFKKNIIWNMRVRCKKSLAKLKFKFKWERYFKKQTSSACMQTHTHTYTSDHSRIWSQPGKAVPGSHLPTGHIGQLNRAQSKASAGPMYSKFRTPSPSEHSHAVPKHQLRILPPPPPPPIFLIK